MIISALFKRGTSIRTRKGATEARCDIPLSSFCARYVQVLWIKSIEDRDGEFAQMFFSGAKIPVLEGWVGFANRFFF